MFAVLTRSVRPIGFSLRRAYTQTSSSTPLPPLQPSSGQSAGPAANPSTALLPNLDFSPPDPDHGKQRTGAKSSKDSLSTIERRKRVWGRASFALLVLGLGLNTVYMGREWTKEELDSKKMKLEDAPSTRFGRTKERLTDLFDYFNKPAWPELLPPPLPPPLQKPYTLVLSVDDLLVTSTWDRQHGWRTAKRPGVDYFLGYISQFYEVVIFTTQHPYTAMPILEKLDRYNFFVSYRLFREATRSFNGKIVKDLSYLNRDLSKVVCLDTDEDHVSTHPENAIVVPKWKGDPKDRDLIALIPFLEAIGIYKPEDVRPILKAYQGKDIALEYAKKEAEAKQKHIEEWRNNKRGMAAGALTLSSLFGASTGDSTHSSPIPPTYLEQKRREAQRQYKEDQAYIDSHKEEFEKIIEQDQNAMAKEVPNNLLEAFSAMAAKKPTTEAAQPQNEGDPSSSTSGRSAGVGTSVPLSRT